MNREELTYKLFLIAVGCDYLFNHGLLFKSAISYYAELQRQKQDKLDAMDNNYFGC